MLGTFRNTSYLCTQKRSILGCTSAIQEYLIAFGLHEHCSVVRHYVKLKNFRLWETQDSKKLKIVLNFQDCLVVSNIVTIFAYEYET